MSHPPTTTSYRRHGFTLCLLAAVLLAFVYPEAGVVGGMLHAEWTTRVGIWLIFFLLGLSLPTRDLAAGYRPLRLQAFVLGWNFLGFPLVLLLGLFAFGRFLPAGLDVGFALLSVLPTTIASAVAFTELSGGRTPSALCATVLSNLLAVLLVPLWAALYLQAGASVKLPLAPLFASLSVCVVLPLLLGQGLRFLGKDRLPALGVWPRRISSAVIVFIVYAAFAQSVASGFFDALSLLGVCVLLLGTLLVLAVVSALVWRSAATFALSRGERIAAFYCASQKSLATGLPLATAILAALPEGTGLSTGAVLLPLMVFHPLQLILAGLLVGRFNARSV